LGRRSGGGGAARTLVVPTLVVPTPRSLGGGAARTLVVPTLAAPALLALVAALAFAGAFVHAAALPSLLTYQTNKTKNQTPLPEMCAEITEMISSENVPQASFFNMPKSEKYVSGGFSDFKIRNSVGMFAFRFESL
jgi:hypothetical protein